MERIGKFLTSAWAVAFSAIMLLALHVWNPSPIQTLQLKSFDYLINTLEPKTSEEIVIVDFGEPSVKEFGQWPFDRRSIALTIEKLRWHGASAIMMPILFSEKDRAGGDNELTNIIDGGNVIIAQTPTAQNVEPDTVRRGFAAIGPTKPIDYAYKWPGALRPIQQLAETAGGVGVVATIPEVDGVVRRIPLFVNIAGGLYPSISIETIRVVAGDISYQIKTGETGPEFVRIPAFPPISTDERGRIWATWNTKFERIEATEVDERVKDKIVVLGIAIEGVGGIIATPVGEKWAHDIQASTLQTIIDGSSISRLSYAKEIEIIILFVMLLLLIVIVPRTSVMWTVPVYLLMISGTIGACYYMFIEKMQLWDASYLVLASTTTFGHLVYNNFARENRLKLQIKKQFGTYLSPALVEKLQKNPELLKLGGDTRELSIMFTDVRGFTTISEHYGSNVQGLTQIMNRYMTAMTAKILENNGTLDKYIGDAQMAFWNAPLDDPDHARNAVATGLAMLDDLDKFNEEIAKEGVPAFGMGLGINTGSVVVGNMGSNQRFDYTCLGDSVNLASRLEGQSKPYGVRIILGQRTAELVKGFYNLIELDEIAVKGKSQGVKIYTIVKTKHINKVYAKEHAEFLHHYRRQHWDKAIEYIRVLEKAFDGELGYYYHMMEERIAELRNANLDYNWDGVYRANSK